MASATLSALDQAEVARLLRQRLPMPELHRRMAQRGCDPAATKAAVRALEAEWRRAGAADFAVMRGREVMQLDDRENELHMKQAELERRIATLVPELVVTGANAAEVISAARAAIARNEAGVETFCLYVKTWDALEKTRIQLMERRAKMCGLDSAQLVMATTIEDEARRLGVEPAVLRERVERILEQQVPN